MTIGGYKEFFKDAGLELSQFEAELIDGIKISDAVGHSVNTARSILSLYGSKLIQKALNEHAGALITSAEASEKHERGLKRATWALVTATVALVIIGVLTILLK